MLKTPNSCTTIKITIVRKYKKQELRWLRKIRCNGMPVTGRTVWKKKNIKGKFSANRRDFPCKREEAMRCKVCGTEYREGSLYCGTCGVRLAEEDDQNQIPVPGELGGEIPQGKRSKTDRGQKTAYPQMTPQKMVSPKTASPKTKSKKSLYGKIGIGAAAIIAVIVIFFAVKGLGVGGRSYEKVVDKLVTAAFSGDLRAIMDLIPSKMIDQELASEGISRDELNDQIDQMSEMMKEQMKSADDYVGANWKVTHEILSAAEVTGDDLEDVKEDYAEANVKVSAAKHLEVKLTIKGDKDQDSNSINIMVVKVGSSWYLDVDSFDEIF